MTTTTGSNNANGNVSGGFSVSDILSPLEENYRKFALEQGFPAAYRLPQAAHCGLTNRYVLQLST